MKVNGLNKIIEDVLENSNTARGNDMYLCAAVLRRLNMPTDLFQLSIDSNHNIVESICRIRRKIQSERPELKVDIMAQLRAEQEEIYRGIYGRG